VRDRRFVVGDPRVAVNERIHELASAEEPSGGSWEFLCECSEAGCSEAARFSLPEYVALRDAGQPVLAAGHGVSAQRTRSQARARVEETRSQRAQARKQAARAHRYLDQVGGASDGHDATVGERVRRLRHETGLSQRELSMGLRRCSYAYLSRIEAGTRTPSAAVLEQLAARLDTTALYLATGNADRLCPYCRRTGNIQLQLSRGRDGA